MPTFFTVFLTIYVLQVSAHAADKIRIGFAPGASSTPFPLAQKKGFLKEEGLEAEIIRMSSTVAVAALTSGSGSLSLSECWGAAPFNVVYFSSSVKVVVAPWGGPDSGSEAQCAYAPAAFSSKSAP